MTTLPQDNNPPARKREIALWLIPLVALGAVTALFLSPLRPEAPGQPWSRRCPR